VAQRCSSQARQTSGTPQAKVTDPRHRRGIRHRLAVILGLAVCAVQAGARSFTAIAVQDIPAGPAAWLPPIPR